MRSALRPGVNQSFPYRAERNRAGSTDGSAACLEPFGHPRMWNRPVHQCLFATSACLWRAQLRYSRICAYSGVVLFVLVSFRVPSNSGAPLQHGNDEASCVRLTTTKFLNNQWVCSSARAVRMFMMFVTVGFSLTVEGAISRPFRITSFLNHCEGAKACSLAHALAQSHTSR